MAVTSALSPDGPASSQGLLIVARLADRWDVEPRTVGRTVFAELAVRPSTG